MRSQWQRKLNVALLCPGCHPHFGAIFSLSSLCKQTKPHSKTKCEEQQKGGNFFQGTVKWLWARAERSWAAQGSTSEKCSELVRKQDQELSGWEVPHGDGLTSHTHFLLSALPLMFPCSLFIISCALAANAFSNIYQNSWLIKIYHIRLPSLNSEAVIPSGDPEVLEVA